MEKQEIIAGLFVINHRLNEMLVSVAAEIISLRDALSVLQKQILKEEPEKTKEEIE